MGRLIRFCLDLSRAILSDTGVRRQWIFFSTLLVLLVVFGGYFMAFGFLQRHPVLFAVYVLASFGGLIFIMLFALFDMLIVRRQYLEARRAARRKLSGELVVPRPESERPPSASPPV